jgi:hypothetical protein
MSRICLVVATIGCLLSAVVASAQPASAPRPRVLAPGVETTISPEIVPEETTSAHDIIEIRANEDLNWTPKLEPATRTLYAKSQDVPFRRNIWALEFSFKPVRMIWIDVPRSDGRMDRQLVWYMVYRVKNTGAQIRPTTNDEGEFTTEAAPAQALRFVPQFVLESQDVGADGNKTYRAYLDRLVPVALEAIRQREDPGRKLLDSVEMSQQDIPISTADEDNSVWGVATWTDVDPSIDYFSIFVGGLTNAYQWVDQPEEYQLGDPPGAGRRIVAKVLQLNFWRPGDEFLENEREIRFGLPVGKADLYGVKEGVAHRWVFR